ncbi:MAG: glutamine synthetase beta-grasp domain-containing protein, partial [Oscillospiraceae bacterium]|nr:glutamine synthetase beta-grasp domain-containing protein [Oscillospiraceae bacterium]
MKYTQQEVMQFVREEDVKFIRLAFCDVLGKQKNISIMPEELDRAFRFGIAIDASVVKGFGGDVHSDLFLRPEPDTLSILPWRPEHGRVVRMFCTVTYPDGSVFENDTRSILKKAIADAEQAGYRFYFGSEMEFYLFKLDEDGERTDKPYDTAGYMDMAPEDKGENVRREI